MTSFVDTLDRVIYNPASVTADQWFMVGMAALIALAILLWIVGIVKGKDV